MDIRKGIVIAFISCLLVVGIAFGVGVSYSNREIALRAQVEAQQKSNTVIYDAVWKIIQQKAEVATEAKDGFIEAFTRMAEARYQNESDQLLMRFIQESNPNFDMSLFRDLSSAIESQRIAFAREQQELIDLKREHDTLLRQFPSSLVVGGRPEVEITIVTSGKTEETFSTGREDDVDLFDKKER